MSERARKREREGEARTERRKDGRSIDTGKKESARNSNARLLGDRRRYRAFAESTNSSLSMAASSGLECIVVGDCRARDAARDRCSRSRPTFPSRVARHSRNSQRRSVSRERQRRYERRITFPSVCLEPLPRYLSSAAAAALADRVIALSLSNRNR